MRGRVRGAGAAAVIVGLVLVTAPAVHADESRVREVVRDGRVLEIVRRVASISGDVRTSETPDTVEVALAADVLFAFDSADLTPEAAARIAEVAARVGAEATGQVAVVGHTDSVGENAYNQTLSEQRAQAVANALAAAAPADYAVTGKGESEPVADEATGGDQAAGLNRRVTISFGTAG